MGLVEITANRFPADFWRCGLYIVAVYDWQRCINPARKSRFIVLSSGVKLRLKHCDSLGQMLIAK